MTEHFIEPPRYSGQFQARELCVQALSWFAFVQMNVCIGFVWQSV